MPENKIAGWILSYLIKNPNAEDTFDGIVEWWLMEERIQSERAEVRKALDELVARGLVIVLEQKSGHARYRLNPEQRAEIKTIVNSRKEKI